MFILWRRTVNGYTVVDTDDNTEEEYTRPQLRKLVRSGIEIAGVMIDSKNVIHFVAQGKHPERLDAVKTNIIGATFTNALQDGTYYVPSGSAQVNKVPFVGNVTYMVTENTDSGNADTIVFPYGVETIVVKFPYGYYPQHLFKWVFPATLKKLCIDINGNTSWDNCYFDMGHCYLEEGSLPIAKDISHLANFENCNLFWGSYCQDDAIFIPGEYTVPYKYVKDATFTTSKLTIAPSIFNIPKYVKYLNIYINNMFLDENGHMLNQRSNKFRDCCIDSALYAYQNLNTYVEDIAKANSTKSGRRIQYYKNTRVFRLEDALETTLLKVCYGAVFLIPASQKDAFMSKARTYYPGFLNHNLILTENR